MTLKNRQLEALLEDTLKGIRGQSLEPAQVGAAAQRVRERLRQERAHRAAEEKTPSEAEAGAAVGLIRGCGDFQALIPSYLAGRLSETRSLLLEDHTRECIPCRRALKNARAGEPVKTSLPQEAERRSFGPLLRWAVAATLVVGLGLISWTLLGLVPLTWGQTAVIENLEGELFQLTRDGYLPLSQGQAVSFGTKVRSAKGSSAVLRLKDGSEIEMGPRAEMELTRRLKGTTVELGHGSIIVEAAKQRKGKLFVRTKDCLVSVTGTIFAVNQGTKGSRVSVVEGRVVVGYGAQEAVLGAGEQIATHASLGPVPVAREVGWSRNVDEYLNLLQEFRSVGQEIDAAIGNRNLRYSTELLNLMPEETVFFAAMPNLSEELSRGYEILQERIATSPVLRSWWEEEVGAAGTAQGVEVAIEQIAQLGEFLGEEISLAFSVTRGAEEADPQPLLLAKAWDGNRLRAYLEEELAKREQDPQAEARLRLIDDPFDTALPEDGSVLIWVREDLVAVALEQDSLRKLAQNLALGGAGAFAEEPFHHRLAQAYEQGIDWLVGADLSRLISEGENGDPETLARLGILDVRYLILERKPGSGSNVHYRAVLNFDGPRRGLASWLAAPAPMASLDFISPDASLAIAALVKDPEQLVEDLFGILETAAPNLRQGLEALEREQGISVLEDFASPLGGEVAVAFDGPLLPSPAWKVVLEVYHAARLQNTLEWLVDRANRFVTLETKDGSVPFLDLVSQSFRGRTFYVLRGQRSAVEVHYTFVDGYLLLGPSRAVLERAIENRDSGYTLPNSANFAALLPQDGHANFSGLSYQSLSSVLGPLADFWSRQQKSLTGPQQKRVTELIGQTPASLACVYGEEDRIIFASNSEDSFLSSLLGVAGKLGLEAWAQRSFFSPSTTPGPSSSPSPSPSV